MDEIEVSIMRRNTNNEQIFQPFLASFAAQSGQPARAQVIDWGKGRSELMKIALYHHGPDVSEVGTTWVSDLVAMNALRPFSAAELEQFGPASSFLPAAWKTTRMSGSPEVWSIPWLTEAYVLHYRKDTLKACGIDEATAFNTLDNLFATTQALRKAGYPLPIAVPPMNSAALILHVASTWVWQAGGELLSPDGKEVAFTSHKALDGFKSYFRLLRCIAPGGLETLNALSIVNCFLHGQAPLAISGTWLYPGMAQNEKIAEKDWGVTRLPGPPFVGGSNLVIWKHTRHEEKSLELARFLDSTTESSRYGDATGIFSAHIKEISAARYQENMFLRVMSESIQNGKTYPSLPLWGLVEDRLVSTLAGIWETLSRNNWADMDETITQALNRVARSLNLTLSQQ